MKSLFAKMTSLNKGLLRRCLTNLKNLSSSAIATNESLQWLDEWIFEFFAANRLIRRGIAKSRSQNQRDFESPIVMDCELQVFSFGFVQPKIQWIIFQTFILESLPQIRQSCGVIVVFPLFFFLGILLRHFFTTFLKSLTILEQKQSYQMLFRARKKSQKGKDWSDISGFVWFGTIWRKIKIYNRNCFYAEDHFAFPLNCRAIKLQKNVTLTDIIYIWHFYCKNKAQNPRIAWILTDLLSTPNIIKTEVKLLSVKWDEVKTKRIAIWRKKSKSRK